MERPNKRTSLGRNLTHGLADALGRSIVRGGYDGRPFPTEAELAREHGVSRSVTREAVKMLTAKGLLSARPRQGTIVQPPTSWSLFDTDVLEWLRERSFSVELLLQFTELRAAIEPAAAAIAATNADAAGLDLIASAFRGMQSADRGGGDPIEADIAFHVAILQASGNPFFARLRDMVSTALRTSIPYTNRVAGGAADLPRHRLVLDAIRKRRPRQAREAMAELIAYTRALIEHPKRNSNRAR
jgi:DNA-binding FadR family transcriptional regulator